MDPSGPGLEAGLSQHALRLGGGQAWEGPALHVGTELGSVGALGPEALVPLRSKVGAGGSQSRGAGLEAVRVPKTWCCRHSGLRRAVGDVVGQGPGVPTQLAQGHEHQTGAPRPRNSAPFVSTAPLCTQAVLNNCSSGE